MLIVSVWPASQNPNVQGSGFIQHPPQVPFAGRLVVQPTTVAPEDSPEWFASNAQVPGQYLPVQHGGPNSHTPQPRYAGYQVCGFDWHVQDLSQVQGLMLM